MSSIVLAVIRKTKIVLKITQVSWLLVYVFDV